MTKVKEPAVANSFYPGEAENLNLHLSHYAKFTANGYEYKSRAVIVPHAGYIYSGQLAYDGISLLNRNIKNIFIIAPSHKVYFEGLAISSYDEWKTPFGNIPLNKYINKELEEKFGVKYNDEAHEKEHAIEVQLPIIRKLFKDVNIIPIVAGKVQPQKITEIIEYYYKGEDCGFIISSDLSHFLDDNTAQKTDNETAQMIESGNIQNFRYDQACGALGIYGLVDFANKNQFSLIRINMYNSSRSSRDTSSVVGYGSWFLYEGSKNKFLKEYYSDYMLDLCRRIIGSRFNNNNVYTNHTAVFNENGACFVTLKKNNALRGCIGSIIAHQPLIKDLVQNAQNAAFKDPRFMPVNESEINELTVNISLLSEPKRITFNNEQDLLEKIVPYKDGIIIKDGNYQAVYLPSVWEELPDKVLFLNSLKQKAGLPQNYFSSTFEAYRFEAEYI